MGTINKRIADDVIAGLYNEDKPLKIVRYTNSFDHTYSYGLICKGDPLNKYDPSPFVIEPTVYWMHPSLTVVEHDTQEARDRQLQQLNDDELFNQLFNKQG